MGPLYDVCVIQGSLSRPSMMTVKFTLGKMTATDTTVALLGGWNF